MSGNDICIPLATEKDATMSALGLVEIVCRSQTICFQHPRRDKSVRVVDKNLVGVSRTFDRGEQFYKCQVKTGNRNESRTVCR